MSDRRPLWEVVGVLATGILFLVFENLLDQKLAFLIPCVIGWTAYLVHRLRKDRTLAGQWGIRLDNLKTAGPPILGAFAVGAAGLYAYHLAFGGGGIPRHAWILFLIYPVWSFIQQFVLQSLVALNLERMGLSRVAVVPIAAILFGLAHLPDWPLAAICTVAGLAWTAIFLRWRQLPLLALSHAWLGSLAYFWVLQRDPWVEMFNR